jgi:hypothetical protein
MSPILDAPFNRSDHRRTARRGRIAGPIDRFLPPGDRHDSRRDATTERVRRADRRDFDGDRLDRTDRRSRRRSRRRYGADLDE